MLPSRVTHIVRMIFLMVFSYLSWIIYHLQIANTDTMLFQNNHAKSEMLEEPPVQAGFTNRCTAMCPKYENFIGQSTLASCAYFATILLVHSSISFQVITTITAPSTVKAAITIEA